MRIFQAYYLAAFISLLGLHLASLATWLPTGDDLYLIDSSVKSWPQFFNAFTNFTGQYRPLTFILFNLHSLFLTNPLVLFIADIALLSATIALVGFVAHRLLGGYKAAILICITLLVHPVFYYHLYALSALGNLLQLFIFTFLVSLLLLAQFPLSPRFHYFLAALTLGSLGIKETFIVNVVVFTCISLKQLRSLTPTRKNQKPSLIINLTSLWLNPKLKHTSITLLVVSILVTFYGFARIGGYQVVDDNYRYVFSFSKLTDNLSHYAAWLLHYPKGWQYGVPFRAGNWHGVIAAITLMIIGTTTAFLYRDRDKRRNKGLLAIIFIATLGPYLFLNRPLVFYADMTVVAHSLIIILGFKSMLQVVPRASLVALSVFALVHLFNFSLTLNQWRTYSFVGSAQTTARNYLETITSSPTLFAKICILDHTQGAWATKDGQIYNLTKTTPKIPIYSTPNSTIPPECQNDALILTNQGVEYAEIKNIPLHIQVPDNAL